MSEQATECPGCIRLREQVEEVGIPDPESDVGERHFSETWALAHLLNDEVVYLHGKQDGSVEFHVLCNDVFAWGCSDLEAIKLSDVKDVYRAHKADRLTNWTCLHRGQRPQPPLERILRDRGKWNEAMDALPPWPEQRASA